VRSDPAITALPTSSTSSILGSPWRGRAPRSLPILSSPTLSSSSRDASPSRAGLKLKAHLELVERYSRSPHHQATAETVSEGSSLADEFLRLACLNYGEDDPTRWQRATELLEASPQLAHANIYTAAAVGDIAAAQELLAADSGCTRRPGGPFAWEPLLYLSYSRLPAPAAGRSAVETARLLLDHGADPNAGYLWEGLVPPFTALTGVFGHGEQGAPPHPEETALARLLLERGANPNDDQTLYNRQ
jgi:hypothetical protein